MNNNELANALASGNDLTKGDARKLVRSGARAPCAATEFQEVISR
jgi:hypothetical protein